MTDPDPSGGVTPPEVAQTLYDPRNGGLALEVAEPDVGTLARPHRTNCFTIYWVQAGGGSFWADDACHPFAAPCLLFFVPYQAVRLVPDAGLLVTTVRSLCLRSRRDGMAGKNATRCVFPSRSVAPRSSHGSSTPKTTLKRLVKFAWPTVAASRTMCSADRAVVNWTRTSPSTRPRAVHCSVNRRTSFSSGEYASLASNRSSSWTWRSESPALRPRAKWSCSQ